MTRPAKKTRKKRKIWQFYKFKRFWLGLLILGAVSAVVGWNVATGLAEPYRKRAAVYDLELINELERPSIILGRDGGEVGRIFVQNRSLIGIEEVPTLFIDALRAGEDKRFFEHEGVDYVGIARAGYDWWKAGEAVSGASTITQQLARGAFDLEAERKRRGESGIERKLVEAFLAMRIEERYSKSEILESYLNRIYFGSGFYGIRSASLGYFGKEPAQLTPLEAATIVGVIKNPTGNSPLNNIKRCRVSRDMVLDRMANIGVLTGSEAARLKAMPIVLSPQPLRRGTSHVYERIADEIRALLGEEALAAGGFTIRTTIDSRVQRAAEEALERSLSLAEAKPGYAHPKRDEYVRTEDSVPEYLQGAALMVDHRSGEVIAHVGGRDYADAPFDVIELGRRPLGTAFHPFLYAAAFEAGLTPVSKTEDEAMDNRAVMVGGREGILGEWGMETATPRYEGEVTLRRALETSKVAAGVRVANQVGLERVIEQARKFELPMAAAELLPRVAVGWEAASLKEVVRAYAAFAKGGELGPQRLFYVRRIEDAAGAVKYERRSSAEAGSRAVSEATAFQIHSVLQGGMERGSAEGLFSQLEARPFLGAGKPGTTHDFSDTWYAGYNGRVSCGVWIGFLQPGKTIYEGAFAKELAMPVWAAAMNAATPDFGGGAIAQPDSVVEVEVCRVSGQRVTPYCYETVSDPATGESRSRPAGISEFFRKGTENLPFCQVHSGSAPADPGATGIDLTNLVVIDTSPVVPKEPTLLGEDPYHATFVNAENAPKVRGRGGRTNVLDSFDLEDADTGVTLPPPGRLEIVPE